MPKGRYSHTRIKRDKAGFRAYITTMYPDIPIEDDDVFMYPTAGDRLETLAFSFYGDTSLWWIIAKANGINGKVALDPSIEIRIPQNVTDILDKFTQLNKYS